MKFGNVSYHLVNTLAIVVEMILNSMVIRWEYVTIIMSWALLYIIYTWGMVATNQEPSYPYDALRTSYASDRIWYTVLYVFTLISFVIWYALSRLKMWLRREALAPLLVLSSTPSSSNRSVAVTVV